VLFDIVGQRVRGGPDRGDVEAVTVRVSLDAFGAAAEEGGRATRVAAVGVGQADSDLGQALPQIALVVRTLLPRRFENLMGVERAAGPKQVLG
jgi:hypothetical protein